jgi:methylase of polypeptide subunit release factors
LEEDIEVETDQIAATEQEDKLLLEARQLLKQALEDSGVNVTGCGFGSGQADIDLKVGGKNYCITLTISSLQALDKEEDNASTNVVKNFAKLVGKDPEDLMTELDDAGVNVVVVNPPEEN